jgi:hypothetical protein
MSGTATHQIAVMGAIGTSTVTIDELASALPINRKSISTAAGKLIRRGHVERLETGRYRLTLTGRETLEGGSALRSGPHRSVRKHPVYADTLQQRAWAAMRLSTRFTIGDIVTLAARPVDKKPEASLQRFFHRLTKAGYLVELPARAHGTSPTSNGFKVWRLMRDSGEHAPRWLDRVKAFKDWNTLEVFPCR